MTKRQTYAAAYFYLKFIVNYSYEQTRIAMDSMEIWQIEDLGWEGWWHQSDHPKAWRRLVQNQ